MCRCGRTEVTDAARILIVDDERSLREFLEIFLRKEGYETSVASNGRDAIDQLERGASFDLVLTDLMMPQVDGLGVLEAVKERAPDTQVLMMTAFATTDTAIDAMKKGAFDYVQKPFKVDEIKVVIEKALDQRRLLEENRQLRAQVHRQYSFHNIIGRSPRMQQVFELVRRVADTRTSVLITGESGTGKELVARAIHHGSRRKDAPMVAVNCGAIPENLMESELFGHTKGSFTGAHAAKVGMFSAADQGTIFLDEVGELPMHLQVKLLRVLQERKIRPVGSNQEEAVDVRVIAATNQDLEDAIRAGRFREDLYYRLNVIRLEIPPLRERREDIALIARHFLKRFAAEMDRPIEDFTPEATELLLAYDFPGNVRELENIVERAVTFETTRAVTPESLPPGVTRGETRLRGLSSELTVPPEGLDLEGLLADLERGLLVQALERTGGNRTEAARLLQISFRSLRYKLDKYDINTGDRDAS
ncbi:MAG: sigma-54-dependent Fis family transcriptional regulator [Deltaproteobacteria bacterium]|nr:sigma-54-dependent Fis family transcriptional regulator [Deltaproteobacteria bacterium]MCB9785514.1 sigma-54-dependent Fis family transcriptional regulator [Deltaproteobacteria bacterium]